MQGFLSNLFSKKLAFNISSHAEIRQAQRGVNSELLSLVLEHADICRNAGGCCVALQVSREALKQAEMRRVFVGYIDKVCNITIIWSELTASVVTVMHRSGRVN
jgi:hypothetical protein